MKSSVASGVIALSGLAAAQQSAYGQCGGTGWTGATTCVSGYTCTVSNQYYSQCLPGSASAPAPSPTTTAKPPSTLTTSVVSPAATGHFTYFGVDESVAEFGTAIPGVWGKDFYFPDNSTIKTLIGNGFNSFRVPMLMERMVPGSLTGSLDPGYSANYTGTINYITSNGAYAIIDPHNYGRYNGAIITDTNAFQTFWKTLATHFKDNSKVIFDTNNEYHDMDQTLVLNLNQAAINGIRAAGATSQTIFAEGNSWTGAWTWNTTNDNLKALTDPQNKLVYEMHQYLDSDGSGTSDQCVSSQIGLQRIVGATAWLKANKKQGVLGEFAGGPNQVCKDAITGMLQHMKANMDVWQGALWWAAGPWWGNSTTYNFEPPSGTAYQYYLSTLQGLK